VCSSDLVRAVVRTCKVNRTMNGYVRLVVTRGEGSLGLNPYHCARPQVIIIAGSIQLYPKKLYDEGLTIVTVGTIRNHTESINPAIKSLNYLNNVMAKIEAINSGCSEAIMLNPQGFVAEATGDNVFVVKGKTLITPPTWCGTLEGITRDVVMRLAVEEGFAVKEGVLTRYDLYTADEVFLTGTAAEVVSVVNIDRRTIGSGAPGPVAKRLERVFHRFAATHGTPIR
jgi:branched-chain amino acid aminotransferase